MVEAANDQVHREQIEHMFKRYSAEMAGFSSTIYKEASVQGASRYLDLYWREASRHAYLLTDGGTNIGFCLVNRHSVVGDDVSAIAEFYVIPRYRRQRHGQAAASEIFRRHGPDWEVSILSDNAAAIAFWGKLVTDIAQGKIRRLTHTDKGEPDRVVLRFNV